MTADEVATAMAARKADVIAELCTMLQRYNKDGRPLAADTSLAADLNIDSVEVMDLVMEIEDKFNVDIPINLLADVEKISDLAEIVCQRQQGS